MTGAPSLDLARAVVEARLRRRPLDTYEASVALEAWGGVSAGDAFDIARAVVASSPVAPTSRDAAERTVDRPGRAAGFASVLVLPAIVTWAGPIAVSASTSAGMVAALLVTFYVATTAGARARERQVGASGLSGSARELALVAALLAALGLGGFGIGGVGLLVGAMAVACAAAVILVDPGGESAAVAIVMGASAALFAGIPAPAALGLAAVALLLVAATGWLRSTDALRATLRTLRVPLTAGATGALLGVVLVGDSAFAGPSSSELALSLLPSALGSYWGGLRLGDLHRTIQRTASGEAPRVATMRLIREVVLLYSAVCAGGSVVVAAAVPREEVILLLPGLALAGLLAAATGLLESISLTGAAMASAALAAAVTVALAATGVVPGGVSLVAGSTLGALVALGAARAALRQPALLLATRIGIP